MKLIYFKTTTGLAAKNQKKRLGEHSGDEKPLTKPKPKGDVNTSRGSKNSEMEEVVSDPESKSGLLGTKSNGGDKRSVRKSVSFEKVPFVDNAR